MWKNIDFIKNIEPNLYYANDETGEIKYITNTNHHYNLLKNYSGVRLNKNHEYVVFRSCKKNTYAYYIYSRDFIVYNTFSSKKSKHIGHINGNIHDNSFKNLRPIKDLLLEKGFRPINNYSELIINDSYYINNEGIMYSLNSEKFVKFIESKKHKHSDRFPNYYTYSFYNKNLKKQRSFFIHRLVMHVFGNPPPKDMIHPTIDHIDHNPHNNNINNLRWLSLSDNAKNVRKELISGVNNYNALLTEQDVINIKSMPKTMTNKEIVEKLGLNIKERSLSSIRRGLYYKNIRPDLNITERITNKRTYYTKDQIDLITKIKSYPKTISNKYVQDDLNLYNKYTTDQISHIRYGDSFSDIRPDLNIKKGKLSKLGNHIKSQIELVTKIKSMPKTMTNREIIEKLNLNSNFNCSIISNIRKGITYKEIRPDLNINTCMIRLLDNDVVKLIRECPMNISCEDIRKKLNLNISNGKLTKIRIGKEYLDIYQDLAKNRKKEMIEIVNKIKSYPNNISNEKIKKDLNLNIDFSSELISRIRNGTAYYDLV